MGTSFEMPPLKIIMVDDHTMFCEAVREIMKNISPGNYFTYFGNVENAREELNKNKYQILLCDVLMPGNDVKKFISHCKASYTDLLIVILSTVTDINKIKEYFTLGADGYLSKSVGYSEFGIAIENIQKGVKYISADLATKLYTAYFQAEKNNLSQKELEILQLVASGYSVIESAAHLQVSPFTIMAHRRNIMSKLNLHSAAELAKYAFENKLI